MEHLYLCVILNRFWSWHYKIQNNTISNIKIKALDWHDDGSCMVLITDSNALYLNNTFHQDLGLIRIS